jgi:hypothetical protein
VFTQHGIELAPPVLVEQIPVASARQLSKEPRWLQLGLEALSYVLGIQASRVNCANHRTSAGTRQHVDVDAVLLQRFEHPQMSHASSGATSECQTDLDASQVMNDTFESMLQQTVLVRSSSVKREFKVSFSDLMQLRDVRSDWLVAVENPHDPDLVSPSGYALHYSFGQNNCCGAHPAAEHTKVPRRRNPKAASLPLVNGPHEHRSGVAYSRASL